DRAVGGDGDVPAQPGRGDGGERDRRCVPGGACDGRRHGGVGGHHDHADAQQVAARGDGEDDEPRCHGAVLSRATHTATPAVTATSGPRCSGTRGLKTPSTAATATPSRTARPVTRGTTWPSR